MAKQVGFLFKNESDLDNTLEANRITLAIDSQGVGRPVANQGIQYAKVTALVGGSDDKEAKCIEVVFDGATNTHVAPNGIAWVYDSDNLANDHTTTNVRSSVAMSVDEVIEVAFYSDKSEVSQWIRAGLGGGSSLIWLTTDNTGLSFNDGARYDRPGGTGTALSASDTYYIATPWNTRIVAPVNHFAHFVQDGTDWYKSITQFAVKPSADYPSGAGAGITTFTCYMDRSDSSLNLGTNTAFPSGIKIILDGFDNVNAGDSSLEVFNGKVFWASYDTAANIIYIIDKNRF